MHSEAYLYHNVKIIIMTNIILFCKESHFWTFFDIHSIYNDPPLISNKSKSKTVPYSIIMRHIMLFKFISAQNGTVLDRTTENNIFEQDRNI